MTTPEGTPEQTFATAHDPAARTDVPFVERQGMPLHNPETFNQDPAAEPDDVVDGEVIPDHNELEA